MKHPIKMLLLAASAATFLLVTLPAYAQRLGGFEELGLEIEAPSARILPMEAVPLTVTLRNRQDHPVVGHEFLDSPYLKVYLAPEGAPFAQVRVYPGLDSSVIMQEVQMPIGYKLSHDVVLWYGETQEGEGKAMFPLPGSYLLKVGLSSVDYKTSIESNTLTIRVVTPTGADSAAWACLKQESAGDQIDSFLFFVPSAPDRRAERRRKLEDFALRFSASKYAAYAWYTVGLACCSKSDRDAAGASYEKALNRKDFPLRHELLYRLSSVYLTQGDIPNAKRYLSVLRSEYPSSNLIASVSQDISTAEKAK
ncbi:MAG: hypothetical protein Q7T82_03745 [Armatimonadota bacterium]|nr:hypothetical protein [Armatimonadota bacterium]